MSYVEARRELGITGDVEKRLLLWLAAHTPAWVSPDHLTVLGLLSLFAGGAAYALCAQEPRFLHVVNAALFLNWLGDSLDGTLARWRRLPRPRYGFYVDHFVDALGAIGLLAGLALSGLVHPAAVAALLVAYLLTNVEVALAAHVTGVFRITRGPIGGTELRLLLAAANLAALAVPRVEAFSLELGLFDLVAAPAAALLLALAVQSAVTTGRRLDAEDRASWPQRG